MKMEKLNKIRNWAFLLSLGFALTLPYGCKKSDDPAPTEVQTVNFGVLLDMTVSDPETGAASKAAIEFALSDLNSYAAAAGRNIRFTGTLADTRMDTTLAKGLLREMYSLGITMFVAGPSSSGELSAMAPFVEQNPVVVINTNSTSIGLNHAGSHIFRIITDDSCQAKAMIREAVAEGKKAIIPVVRNDIWGNSLVHAFTKGFLAEGGFVYPGATYGPAESSFTSLANTVNAQVTQAIATYGADKVAVLALTLGEIAGIMTAAAPLASAGLVKWYGCDGNVQLNTVTSDNTLAGFAFKTGFIAPIMGIGDAWSTPEFAALLSSKIALKTGFVPNVYALSAYDATYIMGLAYLVVGSADMTRITAMIPQICSNYDQMGLSRRLNASNDLNQADYIFWKVMHGPTGYYWDKFAQYMCMTDRFILRWPY